MGFVRDLQGIPLGFVRVVSCIPIGLVRDLYGFLWDL